MEKSALRLVSQNTDREIEQHRLDTMPAPAECKLCGLKKLLTLEQWMEHVDNCQRCKR